MSVGLSLRCSAALLAEGYSSGRRSLKSLPKCVHYLFNIILHLLAHSSKGMIGINPLPPFLIHFQIFSVAFC